MRKLVALRRLLDEAERDGEDSTHLLVDPDDVFAMDPEEFGELTKNPDQHADQEED
jgi:hypothetical protein